MEHDYPAALWIISSVVILGVICIGYFSFRRSRQRLLRGTKHEARIERARQADTPGPR